MPELYQDKNSPIHHSDARVKLILTLAFILTLNLTPPGTWAAYILFLALTFSAALLSRLGIGFLLKRALLALPFALAALPLIFTGAQPRHEWVIAPGFVLAYSPAGLERFASIALRSWISVQAAIILAATTRVQDLLAALRQLRLPALFISIIELMWRYLFVLVDEVTRLLRARASRSAALPDTHAGGSLRWRATVTGNMAGSLFLRALERSDRVYAAMLSRGYNGQPPAVNSAPLSPSQRSLLLLGVIILALLWLFGFLVGN